MEDTRITFETAKLAKEKGFTQETNRFEIPYYNYKGEFKGDVSDWRVRKYIRGEDTSNIEFVSAPTQSLLAKWLREEHSIHINIHIKVYQKDSTHYNLTWWIHGIKIKYNPIDIFSIDTKSKTFEEALEIGLQESLKLI